MTAAEFEDLNEAQAELWLLKRFRKFISDGVPPTLALAFAARPEIAAPIDEGQRDPFDRRGML
jgi:hypothetical protein